MYYQTTTDLLDTAIRSFESEILDVKFKPGDRKVVLRAAAGLARDLTHAHLLELLDEAEYLSEKGLRRWIHDTLEEVTATINAFEDRK